MRPTLLALTLLATTATLATSQSSTPAGIQPAQTNSTGAPPPGWFLSGTFPQDYRTGVEANSIAFLASTVNDIAGFGTLMQMVKADNYAGKRVRFQASVRSENVRDWAGLWMRVDIGKKAVAFDNMETRAIHGTTTWTTYDVVLDVPRDATNISFGTLVAGSGEVWLSNVSLEAVGQDVRRTDYLYPASSAKPTPVFQH